MPHKFHLYLIINFYNKINFIAEWQKSIKLHEFMVNDHSNMQRMVTHEIRVLMSTATVNGSMNNIIFTAKFTV